MRYSDCEIYLWMIDVYFVCVCVLFVCVCEETARKSNFGFKTLPKLQILLKNYGCRAVLGALHLDVCSCCSDHLLDHSVSQKYPWRGACICNVYCLFSSDDTVFSDANMFLEVVESNE